jgi:hypothetical protein
MRSAHDRIVECGTQVGCALPLRLRRLQRPRKALAAWEEDARHEQIDHDVQQQGHCQLVAVPLQKAK